MITILIIYHHRYSFPLRESIKDHLYSFARYLNNAKIFYVNSAFPLPEYILKIKFNLLIFHTTFLSRMKWTFFPYEGFIKNYKLLKKIDAIKIIFPQDEFIRSDVVCDFINDFQIDIVFTTAQKKELTKIYPNVDKKKVKFFRVLTGYLDENKVEKLKKINKNKNRSIDIGYRVTRVPYSLGHHGYIKEEIAYLFKEHASRYGLKTDISTQEKDILLGFKWYKFLLNCKYVIGVEGGSSLLDFDGSIKKKVESYLKKYPKAKFYEIKENCLKNIDGNLKLFALSPRHLEACATKTCQILVEGEYNGILKPWLHYIPLKKNYSNIEEVMNIIKQDSLRENIVNRAYEDIIESANFTYRRFVKEVIEYVLKSYQISTNKKENNFYYVLNTIRESIIWKYIAIESIFVKILKKILSPEQVERIKNLIRR